MWFFRYALRMSDLCLFDVDILHQNIVKQLSTWHVIIIKAYNCCTFLSYLVSFLYDHSFRGKRFVFAVVFYSIHFLKGGGGST